MKLTEDHYNPYSYQDLSESSNPITYPTKLTLLLSPQIILGTYLHFLIDIS